MFSKLISNTATVASSFVAGARKAATSQYTSMDRAVLAAAGVTATIGLVAGPAVAAGLIAGAVMVGRAKR